MALTFSAGAQFDPLIVALVAACGMTLGELSGYLFGTVAKGSVEKHRWFRRVEEWMQGNGLVTLFLLALIPSGGLFDLAGIVAGSTRFPLLKFILACFLGRLGRALILAYAGAQFLPRF